MASSATEAVQGVDFLYPGGVNERTLPELTAKEDFSFLQGLIPNQLGELISYPGKQLLARALQGSTVFGVFTMGDYLLVQTNTNLVRFSNFELFGGQDFTNNLTPDDYPITASEEEAMSQIILKYELPANTSGLVLANGVWVKIPFTSEVRDTGGNCVLAGAGDFTLSAGAYPKNIRIKAWGTIRGPDAAPLNPGNARIGLFIPAVSTTVPILIGNNVRVVAPTAAGRTWGCSMIEDFFVLAAATTYDLRMFVNTGNCTMGDAINAGGLGEKYAMCEMLVE